MARFFSKLEEHIIAALLVAMTLMVFLEVIMRFVVGVGVLWLEELTLHTAAWFILFGASYGVKVGAHIQVDVLVNALGPGLKRKVGAFAVAASVVYCGLIIYGAWIYLAKIQSIDLEMEDFEFPKWIAHSILVIGFGLLAVRLVHLLRRILTGDADGFEVASEAKEVLEEHGGHQPVDPPGDQKI